MLGFGATKLSDGSDLVAEEMKGGIHHIIQVYSHEQSKLPLQGNGMAAIPKTRLEELTSFENMREF